MKLIEFVTIVFLGIFSMGQIDSLAESATDIGAYGVGTGTIGELFFYMLVFLLVAVVSRSYLAE